MQNVSRIWLDLLNSSRNVGEIESFESDAFLSEYMCITSFILLRFSTFTWVISITAFGLAHKGNVGTSSGNFRRLETPSNLLVLAVMTYSKLEKTVRRIVLCSDQ